MKGRPKTGSRQNFFAVPFAFPLVIFAQKGLVFLHLFFQFGECPLDAGTNVGAEAGGMQSAGRERKIQREGEFLRTRQLFEPSMELDQIRRVALQQFAQLNKITPGLSLDRFAQFYMLVADGDLHLRTFSAEIRKGGSSGNEAGKSLYALSIVRDRKRTRLN